MRHGDAIVLQGLHFIAMRKRLPISTIIIFHLLLH